MDNGGYPAGAQYDPEAPYNEKNHEEEIDVFVSFVIEKNIKVKTDHCYPVSYGKDEDGEPIIQYRIDEVALRNELQAKLTKELDLINKGWFINDFDTIVEI